MTLCGLFEFHNLRTHHCIIKKKKKHGENEAVLSYFIEHFDIFEM